MPGFGRVRGARAREEALGGPPSSDDSDYTDPAREVNFVSHSHQLLVFSLDDQRYGLHLAAVERAVRIVEIISLPAAPDIVLGVINAQGRIIPVVDIRKRFCLPPRDMSLSAHLIVARTSRRPVALLVDGVNGVAECSDAEMVPAAQILPGLAYVVGVAKLDDDTILIHDLDTFLSLEDEGALDTALNGIGEAADGS
jgi:purine-binding chemotaxis protein CheW